jgi:hypothetical protein
MGFRVVLILFPAYAKGKLLGGEGMVVIAITIGAIAITKAFAS